ncbi:hypothetical protein ACVWU4_000918 [Campylobacter coli]
MKYAFNKVVLELEDDAYYLDTILSKYPHKKEIDPIYGIIAPLFYKNTRNIIKDENTFKNIFRKVLAGCSITDLVDIDCKLPWRSIELISAFVLDSIHSKILSNKDYGKLLYSNPFIKHSSVKSILNIKPYPMLQDICTYLKEYSYMLNPYEISKEDINYIYIRLLSIADKIEVYTSTYEHGVFDLTFNNINCVLEYKGSVADVRFKEYTELKNVPDI